MAVNKLNVTRFDLSAAKGDPTKVCDSRGNPPYSVTILTGASHDGPKIAVVWSRNSRAVLYDGEGNKVYGSSIKPTIYLKDAVVRYAGVYRLYDKLYKKEATLHIADATQEDLDRISAAPTFRGWISGPTRVV